MNLYIGILIILMASTMHVILALFFSFIFTSIFLRPPVISTGKKITSLLSNNQKRLNLGQNGRVILEKRFNYITFSNKLKKIYTFN